LKKSRSSSLFPLGGREQHLTTKTKQPPDFENSKIEDFLDFAFEALPHKVLAAADFTAGIEKLRQK
jgi:hypothetical protein